MCASLVHRGYGHEYVIYPLTSLSSPGLGPDGTPNPDVESQDLISGPKGPHTIQYRASLCPSSQPIRVDVKLTYYFVSKKEHTGGNIHYFQASAYILF